MSLINDVLQDLDQRRTDDQFVDQSPLAGLSFEQSVQSNWPPKYMFVSAITMTVLLIMAMYIFKDFITEAVGSERPAAIAMIKQQRQAAELIPGVDSRTGGANQATQVKLDSITVDSSGNKTAINLYLSELTIFYIRSLNDGRLIEVRLDNTGISSQEFSTILGDNLFASINTKFTNGQLVVQLSANKPLSIISSEFHKESTEYHRLEIGLVAALNKTKKSQSLKIAKVEIKSTRLEKLSSDNSDLDNSGLHNSGLHNSSLLNSGLHDKASAKINSLSDHKSGSIAKTNRPLNNKQLAEIKYQAALKQMANGNSEKASEILQANLVDNPRHVKARKALAALMTTNGHNINALEVLEKGLEIMPKYTLFRQMIARILVSQNDFTRAIQTLEKGSPVFFTHTEYYALLAAVYQRDKQHHKAIQLYQKLTNRDPQLGMWWLGLGISLEAQYQQDAALKAFKRASRTGSLSTKVSRFVKKKIWSLSRLGESG